MNSQIPRHYYKLFRIQKDIQYFQNNHSIAEFVKYSSLHQSVYGLIQKIWQTAQKSVTSIPQDKFELRKHNPQAYFHILFHRQLLVLKKVSCLTRILEKATKDLDVRNKQHIFKFAKKFYKKDGLSASIWAKLKKFCVQEKLNFKNTKSLIQHHKEYPLMMQLDFGSDQMRSLLFLLDYFSKAGKRLGKIKRRMIRNQRYFQKFSRRQQQMKRNTGNSIRFPLKFKRIRKSLADRQYTFLARLVWQDFGGLRYLFYDRLVVPPQIKNVCQICWRLKGWGSRCKCCKKCKTLVCECFQQNWVQQDGQMYKVTKFKVCPWAKVIRRSNFSKRMRAKNRVRASKIILRSIKRSPKAILQRAIKRQLASKIILKSKSKKVKVTKFKKLPNQSAPKTKKILKKKLQVIEQIIDISSSYSFIPKQQKPDLTIIPEKFIPQFYVYPKKQLSNNQIVPVTPAKIQHSKDQTNPVEPTLMPLIKADPILVSLSIQQQFYLGIDVQQRPFHFLNALKPHPEEVFLPLVISQSQQPVPLTLVDNRKTQCSRQRHLPFIQPQSKSSDIKQISFEEYQNISDDSSTPNPNDQKYLLNLNSDELSCQQMVQVSDSDDMLCQISQSIEIISRLGQIDMQSQLEQSPFLFDPQLEQDQPQSQVLLFNLNQLLSEMKQNQSKIDQQIKKCSAKIPKRVSVPIIPKIITRLLPEIEQSESESSDAYQIPDPAPVMTRNQKKNRKKRLPKIEQRESSDVCQIPDPAPVMTRNQKKNRKKHK